MIIKLQARRVTFGHQNRVYCNGCRLFCRRVNDEHAHCSRCTSDYHLDPVTGEWRAAVPT